MLAVEVPDYDLPFCKCAILKSQYQKSAKDHQLIKLLMYNAN